jgi:hypothetical protein
MWLSTDPAMGEYIPQAPMNDEARRYNQNLPGMGGVFNTVNLHTYHYAGNNPVRYTDPTGKLSKDKITKDEIDKVGLKKPIPLPEFVNRYMKDEGWILVDPSQQDEINTELKEKADNDNPHWSVSSKRETSGPLYEVIPLTDTEQAFNDLNDALYQRGYPNRESNRSPQDHGSKRYDYSGRIYTVRVRDEETGHEAHFVYREYFDINNDGNIDAWKPAHE